MILTPRDPNLKMESYLAEKMQNWNHEGCSPQLNLLDKSHESFLPLAKSVRRSAKDLTGAPKRKFVRIRPDTLKDADKVEFTSLTEIAERAANAWVQSKRGNNEEEIKCFDAGFLIAQPGTPASKWHLESWEDYIMVYTLIQAPSDIGSVETFQQRYENVAKLPWEPPEAVGEAMRKLETPTEWDSGVSSLGGLRSRSTSCEGGSRLVYANTIHRFPEVPFGEASLYYPLVSQNKDWIVLYHAIGDSNSDANSPVFEEQWTNECLQGLQIEEGEEQNSSEIENETTGAEVHVLTEQSSSGDDE
jgi:hypothetical protein